MAFKTLRFVQGLPKTPLLFSSIFKKQVSPNLIRFDRKSGKSGNPGSLTSGQVQAFVVGPGPHGAQRKGPKERKPKEEAQRKGTIFIDGPSMIIIDGP